MGEMGPHYEATSNVAAAKNLKGHPYLTVVLVVLDEYPMIDR